MTQNQNRFYGICMLYRITTVLREDAFKIQNDFMNPATIVQHVLDPCQFFMLKNWVHISFLHCFGALMSFR